MSASLALGSYVNSYGGHIQQQRTHYNSQIQIQPQILIQQQVADQQQPPRDGSEEGGPTC